MRNRQGLVYMCNKATFDLRSKVQDAFWKSIHAAKAEKAQEERERKRRELKERIREIEDPDRQRKYF